ncbi:hypothetical protein GCM10007304_00290 [Rhodococcoides trifolii]|uniref:Glycosyltransferase n=2 Tax=Rhodococcoides trifolii TaxID=908250 RepID=A0A917CKC1_9NOCA|nr:hypothetical protein GCM10007304_00290 [Rhodococcus trifolii]
MIVAGTPVDLCGTPYVLSTAAQRLTSGKALAIGSVNLDHIHHFGGIERTRHNLVTESNTMEWLLLADGMPIVDRGNELTGTHWPRLTGADLLPEILHLAHTTDRSVGFLGGTPLVHELLRRRLMRNYPGLRVSGYWSPDRSVVDSDELSHAVADDIRDAGTDVLVVSLGKPRQELWIDRHGDTTQSRLFLAFGAATDFLAGRVERAPSWMSEHGFEWLYRLAKEPQRLTHRYLIEGPEAWVRLRGAYLVSDSNHPAHGRAGTPQVLE